MATINSHQSESRQVLGINNTDGTALVIDHGQVIDSPLFQDPQNLHGETVVAHPRGIPRQELFDRDGAEFRRGLEMACEIPVGEDSRKLPVFVHGMRPPREPDIEAEVIFLPTAEGGRSTPAKSGYRPHHLVLPDYLTSGHHEYRDKEEVLPGEPAVTEIWFITPDQYPKCMQVGTIIRVQEGSRLVGHAKVLKIFNEILRE